ncbi:MAG: heme lyase NrfEFG subunit NrfE, partial [Ahrensia sp.]
MIVEIGHFALVLCFALALAQVFVPAIGLRLDDGRLLAAAPPLAIAVFACVGLSFAALTWGYVTSDFSILNVYQNSYSQKPLIYKISGVWGNHEGS